MEKEDRLSDAPITKLNEHCVKKMSELLNSECTTLNRESGRFADYRGLAELMGKSLLCIKKLSEDSNPTQKLLQDPHCTIAQLWHYLKQLGRKDVLEACGSYFNEDEVFVRKEPHQHPGFGHEQEKLKLDLERLNCPVSTAGSASDEPTDTSRHSPSRPSQAEPTTVSCPRQRRYDAYINCSTDDLQFAKEMIDVLEKTPYNLRLFLKERDLLPGGCQYEDLASVVEDLCNKKVAIILTPGYEQSDACQFITNFARALDPASKNKQLIPIMYGRDVILPRVLRGMHIISKDRDDKHGWFWPRLRDAILSSDE